MEPCNRKCGKDILLTDGCVRDRSEIDDRRTGFRCCERCVIYDYCLRSAIVGNLAGGRFDYQYFSNGNIHSGADTYIRAENHLCIYRNHDFWLLDFK